MIWNPYASFSPTGGALLSGAPPALRVHGGGATAEQRAAANSAFSRFCATARLSAAPNPTEVGSLPDGTPYRITVVGNSALMELWPAATKNGLASGIGVLIDQGDNWLLTPPGDYRAPRGAFWKSAHPSALHGGVGAAYLPSGSNYVVESSAGVSRSNVRLGDALHGMQRSLLIDPLSLNSPISPPFIFQRRAYQMRISDGNLAVLRYRPLAEDGVGSATEMQVTLPSIPGFSRWGLASATATGSTLLACAIADSNSAAGAACIGASAQLQVDQEGSFVVADVQSHLPTIRARLPAGGALEAPEYCRWLKASEVKDQLRTWTLDNPNPNASNPTFEVEGEDYSSLSTYSEYSDFVADALLRRYVDSVGVIGHDDLFVESKNDSSVRLGESRVGYVTTNFSDKENIISLGRRVFIHKLVRLDLRGVGMLDIDAFDVDCLTDAEDYSLYKSFFDRYSYNPDGSIRGFLFAEVADVRSLRTENNEINCRKTHVLAHDPQWGFAACVNISVRLAKNLRQGWDPEYSKVDADSSSEEIARHTNIVGVIFGSDARDSKYFTKVDDLTKSSTTSVELSFYGVGNDSSNLEIPQWFGESMEIVQALIDKEIARFGAADRVGATTETEGVRRNRLESEESLSGLLDSLFSSCAGDVFYTKDPKTGAGFFSFSWLGKSSNWIVGPWGVLPSSTRTGIDDHAPVKGAISV